MILIQKLHSSGILRFDDVVNDMDFWSRFKFTKFIGAYYSDVI